MGKLYIVRHGKTALNSVGSGERIRGQSKAPLEAEGRADARAAAKTLNSLDITKVVSSDLPRTEETAEIISKALDVPWSVDSGIGPWDLGFLTGKTVEEAWKSVKNFENHPDMPVPEGEAYNVWWKRYTKALWKYITESKKSDENIVLVSHARNLAALDSILEKEDSEPTSLEWAHAPEPGSVVEICVDGKKCSAKLISGKYQGKTLRS